MTTLNQAVKSLNVRRGVESALNNEMKTRERVDRLEKRAKWLEDQLGISTTGSSEIREGGIVDRIGRLEWHVRAGIRARLRWLLFGKVDK